MFLALAGAASAQTAPVVNAHLSTGGVRLGAEVSMVVDVDGTQSATLGELPAVVPAGTEARALIAARVGATRLIDNLPLVLGRLEDR